MIENSLYNSLYIGRGRPEAHSSNSWRVISAFLVLSFLNAACLARPNSNPDATIEAVRSAILTATGPVTPGTMPEPTQNIALESTLGAIMDDIRRQTALAPTPDGTTTPDSTDPLCKGELELVAYLKKGGSIKFNYPKAQVKLTVTNVGVSDGKTTLGFLDEAPSGTTEYTQAYSRGKKIPLVPPYCGDFTADGSVIFEVKPEEKKAHEAGIIIESVSPAP